jgi:tetratricopeptide (TPR) repeat protein
MNMSLQQALDAAVHFHQTGNLAKAKELYQQILKSAPNHPIALHLLGVIAFQAGRNDIAENLIARAIKLKSNFDEAHNNLGNVFKSIGRLQDAVVQYKQAIKIKPEVADSHYNLATALEELGQTSEAIAQYQKAIDIKNDNSAAHFNLGNLFRRLGVLDDSVFHYRKAVSFNSSYAEAYRQIASIKKFSSEDDDIELMQHLIVKPDTGTTKKMHLAFGLGKAFEDLQQYSKAFQYIQQANSIKRNSFDFQIDNWDRYVDRQIKVFNADYFNKHLDSGSSATGPIFILGMPRSGTSLVEQILASHSNVYGAGEVQSLGNSVATIFNLSSFPENIVQVESGVFETLGEHYIRIMKEQSKELEFFTNKMPDNFKIIGMIKLMLPNAKVIHCQRDPMDNCLSLFKNYFSSNDLDYAYSQNELGRYYQGYLKLMKHWHDVLPGFIYDIQYEKIVADQEQESRALLQYCGLEWEASCLNFYQTKRAINTASAAQVRQPVYKDSVQLWKRYEKQLQPLQQSLAYIE